MSPDFTFEKQLRKKGYRIIFGIDEVGVGPLAGPVVAAAVTGPAISNFRFLISKLTGDFKDSKKLTPRKREDFFDIFVRDPQINWAVASVYPKIIDRINVYEARMLAAKRAVGKLEKAIGREADMLILDGRGGLSIKRNQEAIVKGDEKIALCAAASIIAKVKRDSMMLRYHKKYPEYRFDLHKGYGTKLHRRMIKKYGPSPIHRMSFRLI